MISNALAIEPYKMSQVISYIFGTKDNGYSTSLDFITGGLNNKVVIDQHEYEWTIMIHSDRAVTIRRAEAMGALITGAATETPGLNNTPIKLWLNLIF